MEEKRPLPRALAPKKPVARMLQSSSRNNYPGPERQGSLQLSMLQPRRTQVATACITCQRKKAKCGGQRPSCKRCAKNSVPCEYDVDPDTTRLTSALRKHEALQAEVEQLHKLIACIRTSPDVEANEVFRRLRASEDPLGVAKALDITP